MKSRCCSSVALKRHGCRKLAADQDYRITGRLAAAALAINVAARPNATVNIKMLVVKKAARKKNAAETVNAAAIRRYSSLPRKPLFKVCPPPGGAANFA